MKQRKKPDLKVNIPSYPHDYVEMPPETKRLILEANRTPNDIRYIDEDEPGPARATFQVGSAVDDVERGDNKTTAPSTPEVKIIGPEDTNDNYNNKGKSTLEQKRSPKVVSIADSPVEFRKGKDPLRKRSITVPDALKDYEAIRNMYVEKAQVSVIVSGWHIFLQYDYICDVFLVIT